MGREEEMTALTGPTLLKVNPCRVGAKKKPRDPQVKTCGYSWLALFGAQAVTLG